MEWKTSIVHLGHILESDLSNDMSLRNAGIDFMARSNSILSQFRHCDPSVIVYLVKTYASTYFGAVTWKFGKSFADSLNNKFKTMMRVCCDLDNTTHSSTILCLTNSLPIDAVIYLRFINFFFNMVNSDNFLVNFVSSISANYAKTITGNNYAHIINLFGVNPAASSSLNETRKRILSHYRHEPNTIAEAAVVRELYDCVGGESSIPGFSAEEVADLLKFTCCK